MIEPGAVLAAFSVAAITTAALPRPRVTDALARVAAAASQVASGPRRRGDHTWRVALAVTGGALPIVAGVPFIAPLVAYACYVAPSLARDRGLASDLRRSQRALLGVLEWADALVAAGRPAESALLAIAHRGTGAALLDRVLAAAADAASLGAPLFRSIAAEARVAGLDDLFRLAEELERSRDLGNGSRAVIAGARDRLRAAERSRAVAGASRVDTKLMLVLVLCYLPALMLMVVVPLFVGLLGGMLG